MCVRAVVVVAAAATTKAKPAKEHTFRKKNNMILVETHFSSRTYTHHLYALYGNNMYFMYGNCVVLSSVHFSPSRSPLTHRPNIHSNVIWISSIQTSHVSCVVCVCVWAFALHNPKIHMLFSLSTCMFAIRHYEFHSHTDMNSASSNAFGLGASFFSHTSNVALLLLILSQLFGSKRIVVVVVGRRLFIQEFYTRSRHPFCVTETHTQHTQRNYGAARRLTISVCALYVWTSSSHSQWNHRNFFFWTTKSVFRDKFGYFDCEWVLVLRLYMHE